MNNFLNKLPPTRGKKLIQLISMEETNKNNLECTVDRRESCRSKEDLLHPSPSTTFGDVYLATSAEHAPEYRGSDDYDAMQSFDNSHEEENRQQNEGMQFSEKESMLYEIPQKVMHHNECQNIPADIAQEITITGFESLQYPSDTTLQYTDCEHTSNNNCAITSVDILSASFLYNTDCTITECENDYGPDFVKLNKPISKDSPSSGVNLDVLHKRSSPTFAEMRNVEPDYLQLHTDIGLVNNIEERNLDEFDDHCVKEHHPCAENSLADTDPDFEPDSYSDSDTDEEAVNLNLKQKKTDNKGYKALELEAKRESVNDMEARTDREEEVENPLNREKQPKPLSNAKEAADNTDKSAGYIEEEEEVKKTRKRVRRPQEWARNIKKMKVNSGEAYTTQSGKTVSPKNIKEGCNDKCKLKCREKITDDDRKLLLGNFYSLTDINRKRDFISKLMEEVNPRYVYKKHNSNRSNNSSYYLILKGNKVRVCKKMFCDTFCISATFLTTVKKKTTECGLVKEDERGKHQNRVKIQDDIIQGVYDHINSFKRIESHYCRADNQREFIDGDLNLAEMYRLYKDSCIRNNKTFVKKHKYGEIFNTKFNIGFFVPIKDKCTFCMLYENSSDEDKEKLKENMKNHLEEKEMARMEKKKDKTDSRKENSNTLVAVFDLQAVIQLPRAREAAFFYKRKLNTFDFTVYNLTSQQGHCYIWHEGIAKRGAIEISSFVYDFLREKCDGKHVIFYSDNCSSQNKNQYLIAMYLYAVRVLNVQSVTHKYLIAGHTQNAGDSMHSAIERKIKQVIKKHPIYIPSQLVTIAQVACSKQYEVKEMGTKDIFDWKAVSKNIGHNFQMSTDGEKIKWNEIKVFKVTKESPGSVYFKYSFNDNTEMKEFKVDTRPKRHKNKDTNIFELAPAYKTAPGITSQKKQDLLELCKTKAIPNAYHWFFESLQVNRDES